MNCWWIFWIALLSGGALGFASGVFVAAIMAKV